MVFPRGNEAPANHFYLSYAAYDGGGETHLKFSAGRFEYIVYDSTRKGERQPEGDRLNEFDAGVIVLTRGKIVYSARCLNPETASIHRAAFDVCNGRISAR